MKKQTKFIIFIIGLILIVAGIGFLFSPKVNRPSDYKFDKPNELDDFAKCLTDSGAKFYGTFWCSHCANQKKMFSKAFKYISYVECSTPDGNDQLPICKEKNIEGYPTWIFGNGEVVPGELSLDELSSKTSCPLPVSNK